MARANSIQGGL